MRGMPLGSSSANFGREFLPEWLPIIEQSGIEYLELVFLTWHFNTEDEELIGKVKEFFKGPRELKLWSCHLPTGPKWDISTLDDGMRRLILFGLSYHLDLAAEFGAGIVVVHPSAEPIKDEERERRLEAARESLAEIERMCKERGLRMAVETLPRSCLGNTPEELLRLLEGLDEEVTGVCLDSNHANLNGDLVDAVRKLGNRIITLHISDNDGKDERHWLPFEGVIDWKGFISALQEVGYSGPFLYEAKVKAQTPHRVAEILKRNYKKVMTSPSKGSEGPPRRPERPAGRRRAV